jgi:hypothetical protein
MLSGKCIYLAGAQRSYSSLSSGLNVVANVGSARITTGRASPEALAARVARNDIVRAGSDLNADCEVFRVLIVFEVDSDDVEACCGEHSRSIEWAVPKRIWKTNIM